MNWHCFLVKRCHYVLHTQPFKELSMCGMPPPEISMQTNTMCPKLSLFAPISPLSCCTVHRGATVLLFKKCWQARLSLSSSQPRPRHCGDLVWLLPRRGSASAWLIPEQDAERKCPTKKKHLLFLSNWCSSNQRAMEMPSEENVYFEISARCSLCCQSLSKRDLWPRVVEKTKLKQKNESTQRPRVAKTRIESRRIKGRKDERWKESPVHRPCGRIWPIRAAHSVIKLVNTIRRNWYECRARNHKETLPCVKHTNMWAVHTFNDKTEKKQTLTIFAAIWRTETDKLHTRAQKQSQRHTHTHCHWKRGSSVEPPDGSSTPTCQKEGNRGGKCTWLISQSSSGA